MSDLSFDKLNAMHFYGWKLGLKTGLYYLKMRPATDAIKFTVDMEKIAEATEGKKLTPTKLENGIVGKDESEGENLRKRDLNSVDNLD
jgi:ribonucleotide reductase alpha subunit